MVHITSYLIITRYFSFFRTVNVVTLTLVFYDTIHFIRFETSTKGSECRRDLMVV